MAKAINIDHSQARVLTHDNSYIELSTNGSVKVGFGKNLEEDIINNENINSLQEYAGAIRINETTGVLQYCNGSKWVDFIVDEENVKPSMVYSMLF